MIADEGIGSGLGKGLEVVEGFADGFGIGSKGACRCWISCVNSRPNREVCDVKERWMDGHTMVEIGIFLV